MYKRIFSLMLLFCFCLSACQKAEADIDYTKESNWAYYDVGEDKDADLFLICPSIDTEDEYQMDIDDEEMRKRFVGALNMERGLYEDCTRMFAPYYRQAAIQDYKLEQRESKPYFEKAYADISNAFSYYLKEENDGRPIVLAGFSQGADMCYRLLEEYFDDKELYDKLIAVYAIGWPCTEDMIENYPQIVPAQSADDLGTVITFDCEAPEVNDTIIIPAGQKTISINPLNWMTDSTPADASENLGACFPDYSGEIKKEIEHFCGAYIDEERGVLKIPDVDPAEYPAGIDIVPDGSFHIYDYQFFYRNLQENVKNRVELYLNR